MNTRLILGLTEFQHIDSSKSVHLDFPICEFNEIEVATKLWQKVNQNLSVEEKIKRKIEIDDLSSKFIFHLSESLNERHNLDFPVHYWSILLQPWLKGVLANYLGRVRLIRKAVEEFNISEVNLFHVTDLQSPKDTGDAFRLLLDLEWQNARDREIIEFLGLEKEDLQKFDFSNSSTTNNSPLSNWLDYAKDKTRVMLNRFNSLNSGFFINSYMPLSTDFKVQILLRQFPTSNRTIDWKKLVDRELDSDYSWRREKRDETLEYLTEDEHFFLRRVREEIPSVFLEYYSAVRDLSLAVMPKKSKFAFTSNSFHQDEIFKFWIAESQFKGTKYLVGQHGNNYGASQLTSPTNEEITCNSFLTWGWTNENSKNIPAVVLKTAGLRQRSNSCGGLLLVATSYPNGHMPWDETVDYFNQLNQQHTFYESLNMSIRDETIVRIPPLNSSVVDPFPQAWSNSLDPNLLDVGNVPYFKVRPNYRLAVFSYDSTGILEGLASNLPTIGFWLDGLEHLNDFARSKYQILVDAGIVFFDARKCAEQINEIWNQVDDWWYSAHIQEARESFCRDFCEFTSKPAREVARAIKTAISNQ